jgi:hypothetical protein
VELAASSSGSHAGFARAKPYLDAFSLVTGGGKLDGDTLRSRFVAGLR